MAKRLTDTEKWRDEWFLELDQSMKLFWIYLLDTCDHAGVWKVNFKMASFCIGHNLNRKEVFLALAGRVVEISDNNWQIVKFIEFQYGKKLNIRNNAHRGVIKLIEFHGLQTSPYVVDRQPQETNTFDSLGDKDKEQDKDKDMDKEQDKEQEQDNKRGIQGGNKKSTKLNPDEVEVLNYLNTVSGKSYKPIEKNFKFIRSVLKNFTVDEAKAVVDLKQSQWAHSEEMAKYIRPETIFGSKFESYLQETNSNTPKTIGELFRSMGFKGQEL